MIRKALRLWGMPIGAILWVILYIACYNLFVVKLLMSLPMPVRMVCLFPAYWLWALLPGIFALKSGYRPFASEHLLLQILTGIVIAGLLSAVATVLPHLLGLGQWVSKQQYTQPWQFAYELAYCLLGVALVEEWLFRGFLFHRIRILFRSKWVAIGVTSALFALCHAGRGGVLRVLFSGALGVFFCLCQEKCKHCTLLSLIIAHGIYDWLICLWPLVFS